MASVLTGRTAGKEEGRPTSTAVSEAAPIENNEDGGDGNENEHHRHHGKNSKHTPNLKVDWNVTLASTGPPPAGSFPATYLINASGTATCSSTTTGDYMVTGLFTTPSATQANFVAIQNLERNCTGPGSVLIALQLNAADSGAGGAITGSPVISLDGNHVLVVESGNTTAVLHILCIGGINGSACPGGNTRGGGVGTPITAPAGNDVQIPFSTTISLSSAWVDFHDDIAFVVSDDGNVNEITGVFRGTPTLNPVGSGWPVTTTSGGGAGPVLDLGDSSSPASGKLFFVGTDGNLWTVTCTSSPGCTVATGTTFTAASTATPISAATAPFEAPTIDTQSQRIYVVTNNDNGTVSAVAARPALIQLSTVTSAVTAAASLIAPPSTNCNPSPDCTITATMWLGSFDSNFYSSDSGFFWVCGTSDNTNAFPTLLRFAVNGATLTTTPSNFLQVSTATLDTCSAVTEVFTTLNVGGTPTAEDAFFVGTGTAGITGDAICTSGGVANGCLQSFYFNGTNIARDAAAAENGLPTGIVIDTINPTSPPSDANASIFFGTQGNASTVPTLVGLTQFALQ